MDEATTIAEFLARLGYVVDEASQRRFLDAVGIMTKSVLALSAGLTAAAAGVVGAVTTMAGSSEHMYYLAARIHDSVSDVDALAFAFSKLGISPQEALTNIRAMADAVHNDPFIRSMWTQITGSPEVTAKSLQTFSEHYRNMTAEMQRITRQQFPQFSIDFWNAMARGGPGTGVDEYALVQHIFGVRPDEIATQSVAYENALRDVGLRFQAIGGEVQQAMLPALTQSSRELQKWLDDHAPQINKAINDIASYLHLLPEPVRLAIGAFAAIVPSMEKMDAGSVALAAVIGTTLIPQVVRLTGALTSLVGIRIPVWLLSLLGVGGAVVGGAGAVLGYTYEQDKENKEALARGEHPKSMFPLFGAAPGVQTNITPEQNAAGLRDHDAALSSVWSVITRFRDWTNSIQAPGSQGARPTPPPIGAPGAPAALPAAPGAVAAPAAAGDQDGLWQRLQNVLEWINPISAAHAEELPPNIRTLSKNVSDLNDTMTNLLDQQVIDDSMKKLGGNLGSGETGGGAGGTGGGGGVSKGINSPEAAQAVRYFMSQGWTLPQAIGIVSNLLSESGLNPQAVNPTGHAGIAQWDQKRQRDFRLKYGHTVQQGTKEEQLEFVDYELHHSEAAAGRDLSQQFDARAAARSVNRNYERSDDMGTGRMATADALARNPGIYNTNNNAGNSVNQSNNVTINAPTGDANAIANAFDEYNRRHWADVQRNLSNRVY